MALPLGDEYWARFAYNWVSVIREGGYGGAVDRMLEIYPERNRYAVGTAVKRCRERGLLTEPAKRGGRGNVDITDRARAILNMPLTGKAGELPVSFTLSVVGRSREYALSELWDAVMQLEHWDPKGGEPFELKQNRMENL